MNSDTTNMPWFGVTTATTDFPVPDQVRALVVRQYLLAANGPCPQCGEPMELPGLPPDVACARCEFPEANPPREHPGS
jgi:hypothetical protein